MFKSYFSMLMICIFVFCTIGCKERRVGNTQLHETSLENTNHINHEEKNDITEQYFSEKTEKYNNTEITREQFWQGIEVSVGNLILTIPEEYFGGYFDGTLYEYFSIVDLPPGSGGGGYYKTFNILFFNRNSDFDGAESSFNSRNLPIIEAFLNNESEERPRFIRGQVRRSTINEIRGLKTFSISRWDLWCITFERSFIFLDDEFFYRVETTIRGLDFKNSVRREMPEYFNEDKSWNDEKRRELHIKVRDSLPIPEYLQNLFTDTDRVFNSIQLLNHS